MPDQPAPKIELLRAAYAAFNARDIDAALALMTPDVAWPKAFKGGFVRGPEEIRAYWTEQWSEINPHVEPIAFHPEDAGQVLVEVHQVVCDLAGAVLADEHVGHRFTIEHGLIQAMEVCPLPSSGLGA
jgi:ketosteroid isomerase-like protein